MLICKKEAFSAWADSTQYDSERNPR